MDAVGLEIQFEQTLRRRRDPAFRERVLMAYQYRCAVCGYDLRLGTQQVALEAAHIKWHQAGGPGSRHCGACARTHGSASHAAQLGLGALGAGGAGIGGSGHHISVHQYQGEQGKGGGEGSLDISKDRPEPLGWKEHRCAVSREQGFSGQKRYRRERQQACSEYYGFEDRGYAIHLSAGPMIQNGA